MPIVPQVPDSSLDPPEPPDDGPCDICKRVWREDAFEECAECQKPACPKCRTVLDVATVGDVVRHWGTTRALTLCKPCAEQHIECHRCGRLFFDRKGNELCADHDLED